MQASKRQKACYFDDEARQIDFVLVYERPADEEGDDAERGGGGDKGEKASKEGLQEAEDVDENEELLGKREKTPSVLKRPKTPKEGKWRKKFLKNIVRRGLELEEWVAEGEEADTVFVKVHAPFEILCRHAEELSVKANLQVQPRASVNFSQKILASLKIPNIMKEDVEWIPPDYYTCPFKRSKIHKFLGSEDEASFFSNRDRSRIVDELLQTTDFGKRSRAEVGINQLIERGVFTAAYPLHDGPFEAVRRSSKNPIPPELNERQILYRHWARFSKWFKYQPMDNVKEYFGEKIGLYFAWLGFYTAWLLPAAIVGTIVFAYGLLTVFSYQPANHVCGQTGSEMLMCPMGDVSAGFKTWYLNGTCLNYRLSYLFDHGGTVFYAIFMSFWAVFFLENWKRKNATLAHRWDCLGYEEEEERPRPQFVVRAPEVCENPITGELEASFPSASRIPRLLTSFSTIIVMVVFVVVFIIAVIIYRGVIQRLVGHDKQLQPYASLMTSSSAAVVNLILIMVLSNVYDVLATLLNDWEMHRTQTEYEDNLTLKVFIFQFCNYYSSLIYIGFFKGRFVGYPGHYNKMLGIRNEDCGPGGCFIELAQQLGVILIGKQAIGNVQELVIPKIKACFQKMRRKRKKKGEEEEEEKPWERDYALVPNEGLFQEYLEMVLQFGFVTIFVAAFPLAPLFALLNNWIEIRLDAGKFVTETRRPVSEKAEDIGVWFDILTILAKLAVVANAFLIAFTSTYIDEVFYSQVTGDHDFQDYVQQSYSYSVNFTDIGNQTCRYAGHRSDSGELTSYFWQLLAVKLLFVIIFEHIVFFVAQMIDVLIPDIPESLQLKIKRENFLGKQALAEREDVVVDADDL